MKLVDAFLLIWFGTFSCYIFTMMWRGVYWYHEPNHVVLALETTIAALILLYGIYRISRALGKKRAGKD
jgi:divalent metal cation (Fe/Co/Zn/Cd) transporter